MKSLGGYFMTKLIKMNGKLSLFLIAAILILCAGFFVAGCGNDPQVKVETTNNGQFAVDFSLCPPGSICSLNAQGNPGNPAPRVDAPLTVEAWVKNRTNPALSGAVFNRMDATRGIILYVKDNKPHFGMRVLVASGTGTSTPGAPTPTAQYIAGSGLDLVKDVWTHIAGVVANAAHSHPNATSTPSPIVCDPAHAGEVPHLDIFVNGVFRGCGTTWGSTSPDDPATGPQFPDTPAGPIILVGDVQSAFDLPERVNLDAVVDEARLWVFDVTKPAIDYQARIQECMNTELQLSGSCNYGDDNLKVYYSFNNGHGEGATDVSGNGFFGNLFEITSAGAEHHWEDGWVGGNTNLHSSR
jgi:hypothetical protein